MLNNLVTLNESLTLEIQEIEPKPLNLGVAALLAKILKNKIIGRGQAIRCNIFVLQTKMISAAILNAEPLKTNDARVSDCSENPFTKLAE